MMPWKPMPIEIMFSFFVNVTIRLVVSREPVQREPCDRALPPLSPFSLMVVAPSRGPIDCHMLHAR